MDTNWGEERLEISSEAIAAYAQALNGAAFDPASDAPGVPELVRTGLLEPSPDGTRLKPVDPRLIEGRLTSLWRSRAWQAEARAVEAQRELEPVIRIFTAGRERPSQPVEYLHGKDRIRAFVARAVGEVTQELCTAQTGSQRPAAALGLAMAQAGEVLGKGVRMRTLYQHSVRFHEPTRAYVKGVTEAGAEVRTLDEFFDRLFVFDRTVALFPAQRDRSVAVAVYDPAVVRFLIDVFDRNWQRATPFVPTDTAHTSTEVTPAIHDMIKRLLVEGLTDSAIARRLGIAERTYHTHLARIRKAMGATNRLQLGYRLAMEEKGNSPSPPPLDVEEAERTEE